mgnify:CR=1 FL=1
MHQLGAGTIGVTGGSLLHQGGPQRTPCMEMGSCATVDSRTTAPRVPLQEEEEAGRFH